MPIVRPLSWIVAATSVGVVILGAGIVRARRAHSPAPDPATPEAPPPPRGNSARAAAFRPAAAVGGRTRVVELSHLRGRVIAPAGADLSELTVEADDGHDTFEAEVGEDGQFELHLPTRRYNLTAKAGELVGVRPGVQARPGQMPPVDIQLAAGATIEGTVRFPPDTDGDYEIKVRRSGREDEEEGTSVAGSGTEFSVEGLLPGVRYDVTVEGAGLRSKVVQVTAPARLEVVLEETAVLRGAIGFAGEECPIDDVWVMKGDEALSSVEVDEDCHFAFEDLPRGVLLRLGASGRGWHFEAEVSIPERGAPEELCLNPPCADRPPRPKARLEVILTGAPAGQGMAVSASQDEGTHGSGCGSSGHRCTIPDLKPGVSTLVRLDRAGCDKIEEAVVLHPGDNTLHLRCSSLRMVEGVAHGRDGKVAGSISCPEGTATPLKGSVFRIMCRNDATELLYRAAENDSWRRAPLPPGAEPAFVELTL